MPGLAAFPATDTGPYLEREYAWLAGLGFLGKNTCLIHEKLGSGLFLGVALTNLEIDGLPPGPEPQAEPLYALTPRRRRAPTRLLASHCGTCTACLEACPTNALLPEGGLDARRCISTWTIEWRGQAPPESRSAQGGLLFGCDICQSVCPWNQRAAERVAPTPVRDEYAPLPEHQELRLADLARMNDAEFRRRFRRTPLWRAHPEGMRRNAAVVQANLAAKEGS
jgi:epoxyqueuosine reductase